MRAALPLMAAVAGLLLAFAGTASTLADTINVPGDYLTIQEAIDAASDGDTIAIAAGTYYEHDLSIDDGGRSLHLTVLGETLGDGMPAVTIDAQKQSRVFTLYGDEESEFVLANLVITEGGNVYTAGGVASRGNHTFQNCTLINNTAEMDGGAMTNTGFGKGWYCYPTFMECRFIGNSALDGGALHIQISSATVNNCLFTGNYSVIVGGAVTVAYAGDPIFTNCIFRDNETARYGGALLSDAACYTTLIDCVFEVNYALKGAGALASYGNTTYIGCTITGNWTDGGGGGIYSPTSPDSLTDTVVCGNSPDQIIGDWTDNGGNTVEDECLADCPADLNDDGVVNGADLTVLFGDWGEFKSSADIDGSGLVDGADLTLLLGGWGDC